MTAKMTQIELDDLTDTIEDALLDGSSRFEISSSAPGEVAREIIETALRHRIIEVTP